MPLTVPDQEEVVAGSIVDGAKRARSELYTSVLQVEEGGISRIEALQEADALEGQLSSFGQHARTAAVPLNELV